VHGLEREYGDRIGFLRVNILMPESQALMDQYGFSATPEFYLVDKQGQIIGFWDESVEADALRQAFAEALGK